MTIDGVLNLNKPKGKTSFDMVALVRRLSGERRVGHAGTLDPEATGVLPVALGQGTRVIEFLTEAKKRYRAELELGIDTDTYDASGKVIQRGDTSSLTREQVEVAVASFLGPIDQIPPMYSAVKHQGQPLYRLARAGVEVPRKARRVEISYLGIVNWQPPLLTIEVECSKGTYIRSLANDLGRKLGCGAHLRDLVRLRSGPFHISEAVTIPDLEDAFRQGHWLEFVHPIDVALLHLAAVVVDEEGERVLGNGRPLILEQGACNPDNLCRAYSRDGRLIALLRYCPQTGSWQPEKVFARNRTNA